MLDTCYIQEKPLLTDAIHCQSVFTSKAARRSPVFTYVTRHCPLERRTCEGPTSLDARTLNLRTSGPDTLGPVSYHASKEINHQLKTRTLNPRTLRHIGLGLRKVLKKVLKKALKKFLLTQKRTQKSKCNFLSTQKSTQ